MSYRFAKHAFAAGVVLSFAGCAGGGCAGCGGAPIPGGFPLSQRMENAGSIRLTKAGLDFVGTNVGKVAEAAAGGAATSFPIPESVSQVNVTGIGSCTLTVCPGGPSPNANPPKCVAEIDLKTADLTLESAAPDRLVLRGDASAGDALPVRLQNLPVGYSCAAGAVTGQITVVANGNNPHACPGAQQLFAPIGLEAAVAVRAPAAGPQAGYSELLVEETTIDQASLEDAIALDCGGGLDGALADAAKGLLVAQLASGIEATVQGQIASALCREPPCPEGSTEQDGVCIQPGGACLQGLLGMESRLDVGAMLASISPGTRAGVDLVLAAGGAGTNPATGAPWGQLDPSGGGATLGMYGGLLGQPVSACVEPVMASPPQGVPIPAALFADAAPGWPAGMAGPHLGIALSEKFLTHAMVGVYNSGLLCLDITAEGLPDVGPLLNTGAIKLVLGASGLEHLGIQDEAAPVAVALRPGAPPEVEIGAGLSEAEPLLGIRVPDASLDLYAFSLDRFVRFLTLTYDVRLSLNLKSTSKGLTPELAGLTLENGKASNFLGIDPQSVKPASVGETLASFLKDPIATALAGATVDLNEVLAGTGLSVSVPEEGIQKLSQGEQDYLTVFATFK